MEITYRVLKDITPEEASAMAKLYVVTGWIESSEAAGFIIEGMKNSAVAVGAYADGELIGMGRALSDNVSDAYIQDIAVSPAFRRHGIGKNIVKTIVAELRKRGVDWIALVGEPGTEEFYKKLGFESNPDFTFWKLPPRKLG
ncbi:MAG: GNAT family N-acetyltransferase [Victivallales bacterium]|jgi:spermidine synthase|nr:GNAT family N-acetyltransferase [Victivallales bacterium]